MINEQEKLIKLGRNIAKHRKEKKLSQNSLSELLEISREHLAKIETAKRGISINLLFKLSDVLGVPESSFFKFK